MSIYIPEYIPWTEIGESAFEYCSSLEKVVIPGSVTEIGKNAFMSLLEQMKGGKGKGDLYVPYTIAEGESL